ncbi:MAG TPA: discoidin domain-containing protein [Polyangiaceae bacterium]|nr:discoidin domain-containing protein [Polyangiaceae bacterium]
MNRARKWLSVILDARPGVGENRAPMVDSRLPKRRAGALLTVLLAACLFLVGCVRSGTEVPGNLLFGKAPLRSTDVTEPARLTDGTIARSGDHWETDLTSVLKTGNASVEWDLGRSVHVRALYLQGDNNDEFFVSASDDGTNYRQIWEAPAVRGAGMRVRETHTLDVTGRYLKLTARSPDNLVSASELEAFEVVPSPWPPVLRTLVGERPRLPGEASGFVLGLVASLALLLHRRTHPAWARWLSVLVPLVVAYVTYDAVASAWPPQQPVIDMLRAVAAAVAAAAVLRLAWRPEDVMPRFVDASLAAAAFLALTTFFNMWQPQFDDVDDHRMTWVHTWDMRVYFPSAKYFDELGFDGLYLASVEAYLEDAPGATEQGVANVEIRDLRNYEMTTVKDVISEVRKVKQRFTPERWDLFKHDMAFFWRTMGPGGYLGSLRDHGGNATPAWLLVAHLLFRHATASEGLLAATGLLDPLLLALFFTVAWRTFGLRSALVCLTVYGASTFPWFGSNWVGSTLRNDWMVLVGLGACALYTRRYVWGGAALAGAAMIRAFPAVSVFYLAAPLLVLVYDKSRAKRPLDLAAIREEAKPMLRAVAGAAVCVTVLFVLSTLTFGFRHAWVDWAHKITMHSTSPNVNHVGLRTLIQFDPSKTIRALSQTGGDWSVEQARTFMKRRPLYVIAILAFTLLSLAAARGRDLRQAALIGMMMIPIFFYPSNYYLHYVFVLPLMMNYSEEPAARKRWGLVSFVVLAICVSEYWGFGDVGVDERYAQWSVGVLIGYLVILVAMARESWAQHEAATASAPPPEALPATPSVGQSP